MEILRFAQNDKEIDLKVTWQKLDGVEVQVFQPDAPSRQAILFCTGFPGLGGAMFEQRHASALAEAGYDLYVIHHKGALTTGAMAPASINNGKRIQDAWEAGETHLGGGAATIDDLLNEPLVVLKEITALYDSIHVIGNSFGALSSLASLTVADAPIENVKSLILLAGAQGVDDGTEGCIMRIWTPEFMAMPHIVSQIEVRDVPRWITTLKKLYADLPGRVIDRLPAHITLTYVVMEHDELLRPSDTVAFQAAIGGRGRVMIDSDEKGFPAYAIGAHYTPNYKTKDLLEVIRG